MDHVSVRLLKERFDLEHGEAEHILGSFVDAVERSLDEYGICHVTGIGSFVRAPGDSRISFEPADELTRAVNVRFADLPVYEIDTEGAPDPSTATSMAEGGTSQPESAPTTEGIAIPPGSDEPGTLDGEPTGESGDAPAEAVVDADTEEPVEAGPISGDTAKGSDLADESEQTTSSRARSRGPRSRREKTSSGIRVGWIAFPVLILVAVAAVWMLQRPDMPETESDSIASRSTPATQARETGADDRTPDQAQENNLDAAGVEASPDPSTDSATGDDQAAAPDPTRDASATGEVPPGRASQATDALRATDDTSTDTAADEATLEYALDRTVDGYTMIVGSSPDRNAADEQLSRFTELDLPFGVLDYSEDGSPMYRLAVGLFDSAEQADSARQAMAETLPSGTWVWRIR